MLIIKPLAWLFRCLGLVPSVSPAYKYFLLIISAALSTGVYFLINVAQASESIADMLIKISRGSTLASALGYYVYNFWYIESYSSILNDFKRVKDELREIGATPKPFYNIQRFGLFFFTLTVSIKLVTETLIKVDFVLIYQLFLIMTLCAIWIQHMVVVSQLNSLFSALNDQLRRISAAADDTPVDVVSAQLQSVFRIHTSLHVTVSNVNDHFFIYNFMITASRLFYCIVVMYNYLLSLSGYGTFFVVHFFSVFIIKIICFVAQCVVCHACAKEANHTVLLAHHILQPHTPFRLWKEVGDFSSLYLDNKVEFSVGGVFTLDRPLITRLSVLALSYLIVAVQLKDAHLFDDDIDMITTSAITDTVANITNYNNLTVDYDYVF